MRHKTKQTILDIAFLLTVALVIGLAFGGLVKATKWACNQTFSDGFEQQGDNYYQWRDNQLGRDRK